MPRRINPFDKVTFLMGNAKGGASQFGTAETNERKYKRIYSARKEGPISPGRQDVRYSVKRQINISNIRLGKP